MPIPSKRDGEDKNKYMSRCMSDKTMKKEFPDNTQRVAVCMSKAMEGLSMIEASDMEYYIKTYGYTEDVTEDNFYVPSEAEYVDFEEKTEEWDCAVEKPGLWENIRKKKEREGKKYKPAKPGDKDRPDPEAWKQAQSSFKYKSLKTGEVFFYTRRSKYKKDGEVLTYLGETEAATVTRKSINDLPDSDFAYIEPEGQKDESGKTVPRSLRHLPIHDAAHVRNALARLPVTDIPQAAKEKALRKIKQAAKKYGIEVNAKAEEYQGHKVTLNKPFRTPDGPKKFSVYVKNDKGNVVKVNFGDPNMEIKRDDPERRKSFRARHHCDTNPGPKWKARYWSCKNW